MTSRVRAVGDGCLGENLRYPWPRSVSKNTAATPQAKADDCPRHSHPPRLNPIGSQAKIPWFVTHSGIEWVTRPFAGVRSRDHVLTNGLSNVWVERVGSRDTGFIEHVSFNGVADLCTGKVTFQRAVLTVKCVECKYVVV